MTSPARFSLRTFGGFALDCAGQSCDLAYEKGRALLAYLAAEPGRSHSRSSLAAMFWPDLERDAALTNLRQVLRNLRQVLEVTDDAGTPILVGRESVRLEPSGDLEIDATLFSSLLPACLIKPASAICEPCLLQLESIAACYRGRFMAGFSLPDCPDFEEWLQAKRETLHLHALVLLTRISDCYERSGAYGKSLPFARRFLSLEPWNEEGLRRTMRLLALSGQRAAAIAAYESCCQTLKKELGILPSGETVALVERIRTDELSAAVDPVHDAISPKYYPEHRTERRQLTVLYCELVPAGVEDMDQALALLGPPQAHCREIICSFAGHLVGIHGGSLLAYFGYPQASENAARQAVQAALAALRTDFTGVDMRAGIHTGMVISGSDPQVPDVIGSTSARAICLRRMVGHGALAISEVTQRLVAGYFESESLGVKEFAEGQSAMEVFRVIRQCAAKDRLEAASALSALVGRKKEISTLRTMWREARRGHTRVVLLRGDAGVGKSRLVLALKQAIPEQDRVVRVLRCYREHCKSPFFPMIALFDSILDFAPDDSAETKFEKLVAYAEAHYAEMDNDTVPLLAKMLSLPLRAPFTEPAISPQQQRSKTLNILFDRLYALAEQKPVLLLVEDIHWSDPSSLEFLTSFVVQMRMAPILGVFTARTEFIPPWDTGLVRTLTLNALDDAETSALIVALAPGIRSSTVLRLVERSDGIPLFAEELAREIGADDQSEIPASLRDLLATRLDGLGAAKFLAQSAASIGREFNIELLRKVSRCDEPTLSQLLLQLQLNGILHDGTDGVFHFRHALIRDAAYQSQTRPEREAVHRLIANTLKTSGKRHRPEFLAQHWAAGGEIREAVASWIEAGKLASHNSACQEAVLHFKSGLALIGMLPAGQERLHMELELHIGLGTAVCAVQGYAASEGLDAYKRAMALCAHHESDSSMFRAIWGLWASASSRVGYSRARELAVQILRIATKDGNPVHAQQSHFAIANTLYWQGEFIAAREHLEWVKSSYLPAYHENHVAEFGEDAGITSGSYASWVLWFLGYPDQARRVSSQTLELARRLGHPYSLAYALTFAAILNCRLRLPEAAIKLADETLSLASVHGFPLWQIGATLSRGWALTMQGSHQGIASLLDCVDATRVAMGGVTLVVLEPLVDAYVKLDLFNEALGVHDEAMAAGSAIDDHHIEAELHRLKGESLLGLAESGDEQAAACFDRALAISRQQQSRSLELRAAMSLAMLWRKQGRQDDARHMLEGIYSWFTEGFDTPDLQAARGLLDSLTS